ncbi:hypothetical protein MMC14_010519 [Varicellaria rhodocarpa]|nr:hypothetical protein [Varicellaria rhodocarpa]
MAFCQPPAVPQRQKNLYDREDESPIITQHARVDDAQEWILFSPTHPQTDTDTQTAGRSRISDFGSFNNLARSNRDQASDLLEDDEELDSLDDGLHAFQEPSVYNNSRRLDQSGGTILPAHDGLGTFAASSSRVQEQLWSFEHYNPCRRSIGHRRRRSSIQRKLEAIEDEDALQMESSRVERIEKWRMDQSKALLDEIEKETRRRRDSRVSEPAQDTSKSSESIHKTEDGNTYATHSNENVSTSTDSDPVETETFLERITRRVIQDLIGIDDSILSVILGESLLPETPTPATLKSSTSNKQIPDPSAAVVAKDSEPSFISGWEDKLLTRLARELGILVHQLSEHPGAFSTYRSPTMDYAGIPITQPPSFQPPSKPFVPLNTRPSTSTIFKPTLQDRFTATSDSDYAARWGIEDSSPDDVGPTLTAETEYWEQTPDLKTVFSYLQRRFTSQQSSSINSNNISTATESIAIATSNSPASLRRAAIIRQHHPLISRSSAYGRQKPHLRRGSLHPRHNSDLPYNDTPLQSPSLKRPGSACASISTKKSRRESKRGSENYWDLDLGGVGSEISGALGGWGEV